MKLTENITGYILTVKNELPELGNVVEAIGILARKWELSDRIVHQVNLALEEVITNIIFYAYTDKDSHEITLIFSKTSSELMVEIKDDGQYFNLIEQAGEVDITQSIDEREIGGLGIHILKEMVDDLHYSRDQQMNILKLTKQL